jgi:hypothetical protein
MKLHTSRVYIYTVMTSNGLRAQYLMPNLSLSAIAYPSIRPLRSGQVITQSHKISANSPSAERKRIADRGLVCRIFLKKLPSSERIFSPSWAHKSDSFLYQILVLTGLSKATHLKVTNSLIPLIFLQVTRPCSPSPKVIYLHVTTGV